MQDIKQRHQESLSSLKGSLDELDKIKVKDLVRTEDLGTKLGFQEGAKLFEQISELFNKLSNVNFDLITSSCAVEFDGYARSALDLFNEISNFNAEQGNPLEQRNNIINRIDGAYNEWFKKIAPIIAFCNSEGTTQQADKDVAEIKKLKKRAEESEAALSNILGKTRDKIAGEGVAQHILHFQKEVDRHQKAKKIWLWVTGSFGAVLVAFLIWNVRHSMGWNEAIITSKLVQISLSKVLMFSVLSFFFVLSARIYRVESHNLVVNQHRQNALGTFEEFIDASLDKATKSAVLLQTAQCIFSHQNTGFTQGEQDNVASSQRVLEIIRNNVNPTIGSEG